MERYPDTADGICETESKDRRQGLRARRALPTIEPFLEQAATGPVCFQSRMKIEVASGSTHIINHHFTVWRGPYLN